jgi:hypothetical protein
MWRRIKQLVAARRPEPRKPADGSLASLLGKGGVVVFSFLDRKELSGRRFEIAGESRYAFGGATAAEYLLRGEKGEPLWLAAETEDGEEYVAVSRKLRRKDVAEIWGEGQIAAVLEEGFGARLESRYVPESLAGWVAASYHKAEDASSGTCYEGASFSEGAALDYYLLEDAEEEHAVEIEVYESGETEIFLTLYLPRSAIAECWPGR